MACIVGSKGDIQSKEIPLKREEAMWNRHIHRNVLRKSKKHLISYKEIPIGILLGFSVETSQARTELVRIFKVLKDKIRDRKYFT